MKKALEGGNSNIKFEKRYIHKSGRIVYASVSSLLVHDIDGKPRYFFSQISDISKQKESEHELANHKKELESLIKDRTSELDEKALKLEKSQQALTFLLEDVNDIKKQLEVSNSKLLSVNEELETKYAELEKLNKIFVGRELRMVELKGIIKVLKEKMKERK